MAESRMDRRTLLGSAAGAAALTAWSPGGSAAVGSAVVGSEAGDSASGDSASGGGRTNRRVRLGVNYTPSTRWFHMWEDWREADLRRDLDDIASLGLDHIRLLLVWSVFQPEPALISGHKLDLLARFLDLADEAGLDVEVTVFNGHISARYWTPNWLRTEPKPTNWFTDPAAIAAQRRFLHALAQRVRTHPRFLGFDLSNEVYYYWDFAGLRVAPEEADAWLRALSRTSEEVAPGKWHTKGCDSAPWDADGTSRFHRAALATAGSVTSIHPWTAFSGILRNDPLGPRATHNAERLVELMRAYGSPQRPTWVQEDGAAPSLHFSDDTRPSLGEWIRRSATHAAGCERMFGFTWWCSHDVSEPLVPGLKPLEYDLGLFTHDRRRKPAGTALRRLAEEWDRTPPPVEPRHTGIVVADDQPDRGTELFFARAAEGHRSAFVLDSRADDAEYLRQRGITDLLRP